MLCPQCQLSLEVADQWLMAASGGSARGLLTLAIQTSAFLALIFPRKLDLRAAWDH